MRSILSIVGMMLVITSSHGEPTLTARQIADSADYAGRLAGSEMVSTLKIIDAKGRERVRQVAQITKMYDEEKTEKKLIRFLAPADVKGTGLLTFDYDQQDDDMWLFMPALRKTRRIISTEKSTSFMGSEFSYADMTPPGPQDFSYQLLGEEVANGTLCWKIELLPVSDKIAEENGFSKRISYIGKPDFVVRKALYYNQDGELNKELNVFKVKALDPANRKFLAVHLLMENKQNGRKSELVIDEAELSKDVKDEYFTTRYLERP